jgi:hypothetical protein
MKALLGSSLLMLALAVAPGVGSTVCAAAAAAMTLKSMQAALAAKPVGADAEQLAGELRRYFGHGFHSDRHGRAIFPDALRWLWRDYKP